MTKCVLLAVLDDALLQFVHLLCGFDFETVRRLGRLNNPGDLAVLVAKKVAGEVPIFALLAVLVMGDYVQPLALL
jgi:hypothetical protein